MNILLFLTPKNEVTLLYDDFTIGQALRTMERCGHAAVPIICRTGEYVVDDRGMFIGIITRKRVLSHLCEEMKLQAFLKRA